MAGTLRIAMIGTPFYEIPPSGYGGIELVCAELVDALVERGHEVTLFSGGTRNKTRAGFVSTTPRLHPERLGHALPELLHTARANRLLNTAGDEFDIVHDHSTAGPVTAACRSLPTVVTVHGPVRSELGDLYADLGRTVGLVAISDSQRRHRPELNWLDTVHHGVDVSRFAAADHRAGPVLWLGRFCAEKGPDLAIKACRAAGLPLVLAGKCNETEEQQFLAEIVEPLLGPDVTLTLNADRATTQALLTEASCLVMPIRWHEPFGMVMIEAMASGTPVIALRRGSVPEIVRHGVTGFVCDDVEELAGALLRSGELSRGACVEHVRTHFSAAVMAQRYEAVYRRAIAGHRARVGAAAAFEPA